MLWMIFLSCSDFGIFKPADVYGPDDAKIAVPSELDVGIVCGGESTQIEIFNEGLYPLTIEDITISGGGWLLDTFTENAWNISLPFSIEPDTKLVVPILAGDAEGKMQIQSSDPDQPTSTVSLLATHNETPTIEIISPSNGTVLPRHTSIFEGRIQDDRDLPGELLMQWRSSIDGVFGDSNADEDGNTQAEWSAMHSSGNHIIQLMATDICGEKADAQIQICQESGFSEESMWQGDWLGQDAGQWSETEQELEIIYTEELQKGAIFAMHETLSSSQISLSFRFSMEGSAHEGFALVALQDNTENNDEPIILSAGEGCLGYGSHVECGDDIGISLGGWMLEFDTKHDSWDPTQSDHVAFVIQGQQDSHVFWTEIDDIQNNGWHEVELSVLDGIVEVELDGALLFQDVLMDNESIQQFWTDGMNFPAYIGFTGAGHAGNQLLIDDLYVIEPTCSL